MLRGLKSPTVKLHEQVKTKDLTTGGGVGVNGQNANAKLMLGVAELEASVLEGHRG